MADMVKRIHKKGAEFLNPGEQVLAASVVMPVGGFKKTVAFGAVGGVVGAAVGAFGDGDNPEPDTMAESFATNKQAILALSNQRWILFEQGSMSGAVKGVSGEWSHADISSIEIEKGKLLHKVNVSFSDGSVAKVEAVKASKPEKLVEAAASL